MPYERPRHNSEHTKKPFCQHDDVQVECAIFMPLRFTSFFKKLKFLITITYLDNMRGVYYDRSEEIKIKVETTCSEYANNKTRDKKNKKKVISPELTNVEQHRTPAVQIDNWSDFTFTLEEIMRCLQNERIQRSFLELLRRSRKFCTTSAPQINIENVTKVKSGSFLQITTASTTKEIDLKLKLTNQPEQIKCEAILKPATLHITSNAPKNAKSTFAMNYQEEYRKKRRNQRSAR
ncbi:hypothetical protein GQX74_011295 [Glossina fuscipes]|nr:hypothetical protein GQX74_011295 [Glossina fuscipes]